MELIPDGYTRVSEILSIFQAYAFVEKKKLAKAQETGTLIHEAIESYIKGEFEPVHPSCQGYFDSFIGWHQNQKMTPILQEKRFFHKELKITGRLDLLADLNGKPTVVDFKTGSWAHPEIWRLQGTFYRHLLIGDTLENVTQIPDQFLFLQLQRSGDPAIEFYFDYDPYHWEICKKAISLYEYFTKRID